MFEKRFRRLPPDCGTIELHPFRRDTKPELLERIKLWCLPYWKGDTLPERIKQFFLNGPGAIVTVAGFVFGYFCVIEVSVHLLRALWPKF